MSITVNSRIVAEARIQGVTLRPVVGAYELLFGLDITANPISGEPRRVSIIGARVNVRTNAGGLQQIGFARPESTVDIRQYRRSHVTCSARRSSFGMAITILALPRAVLFWTSWGT